MSRRYRKRKGRGVLSTISLLVRQLFLPNPFENMFPEAGTAEVVNLIFGGIFVPLAFLLTRTWYVSGVNEKWEGIVGFFINYCVLTGQLLLISKFISDIYWIIGIFGGVYLILCFLEGWLLNRNKSIF